MKGEVEVGVSRQKNALNFGEDFFFGDHSILAEKRSEFASIQLKPNENSDQVRLQLNQTSKKAPPPLRNPGYATVSSHSNNYSYI